ncbi:MAG: hypothetical protein OHK0039_38060 [Bacteroidia bacterium]
MALEALLLQGVLLVAAIVAADMPVGFPVGGLVVKARFSAVASDSFARAAWHPLKIV